MELEPPPEEVPSLRILRTFGVMYDHTFSELATHRIRHQATHNVGCQPGHLHMATLVFLRGLCGYVWDNILTLSPLEGSSLKGSQCYKKQIKYGH